MEEANKLTKSGSKFFELFDIVRSRVDSIRNVIDDVSQVSQSLSIHNLAIDGPTRFIPSLRPHGMQLHWYTMYVSLSHKADLILRKHIQAVSNQIDLDGKVVDLSDMLKEVFDFVNATNDLRSRTRLLEHQIIKLLETTSDCCTYLRDYSGDGFLSTSPPPYSGRLLIIFEL